MVIMATVAMKSYGAVVLPTAKSVVGTSLKAVSHLAKEGEQAAARYLRHGETSMRLIEQQGNVKFMDTRGSDLEAYRNDLRDRGVRFNVEDLGSGKVRLWYVASDSEKIKAAIIDAGARFVAREQGVSAIEQQAEAPSAVRIGAYEMDRAAFDEWMDQAVSAASRNFRDKAVGDEEISALIENSLVKPQGSRNFEFEGEKFDVDKALADEKIKEAAVEKNRAAVPLEKSQAWRDLEPTAAQAYTIGTIEEKELPLRVEYETRGEASDVIGAAWNTNENAPALDPPTPEQNAAIADMKSAGRIGQDIEPATVSEAHEAISGVLERESKGAPAGGRFASVQEAVAFIQGKNAMEKLGNETSRVAERGAEKAAKAAGEAFER